MNPDWIASSGPGQILNRPNLATVATTGNYNDLINKPPIPAGQVNADWKATSGVAAILNKPSLSAVATSGNYNDLSNKPSIPAPQLNADWNATSGVAAIFNKPAIDSVWSPTNLQPMTLGGMGNFIIIADAVVAGQTINNPRVRYNGPVMPGTWLSCGEFSSGSDQFTLVVRIA